MHNTHKHVQLVCVLFQVLYNLSIVVQKFFNHFWSFLVPRNKQEAIFGVEKSTITSRWDTQRRQLVNRTDCFQEERQVLHTPTLKTEPGAFWWNPSGCTYLQVFGKCLCEKGLSGTRPRRWASFWLRRWYLWPAARCYPPGFWHTAWGYQHPSPWRPERPGSWRQGLERKARKIKTSKRQRTFRINADRGRCGPQPPTSESFQWFVNKAIQDMSTHFSRYD